MDINLATVMLHIQEPLDELSRRRLEDTMREDTCVGEHSVFVGVG